jgi:hypothetical protein
MPLRLCFVARPAGCRIWAAHPSEAKDGRQPTHPTPHPAPPPRQPQVEFGYDSDYNDPEYEYDLGAPFIVLEPGLLTHLTR